MLKFRERTNTWPGFVDLFSNLVIILIFLLIVFVFLWTTTTVFSTGGATQTIASLQQRVAERDEQIARLEMDEQQAIELLTLARAALIALEQDRLDLTSHLQDMTIERVELERDRINLERAMQMQAEQVGALEHELVTTSMTLAQMVEDYERRLADMRSGESQMVRVIESLEQQLRTLEESGHMTQAELERQRASLADELSRMNQLLGAAEQRTLEQEIFFVELSNRLNRALADKVAELQAMELSLEDAEMRAQMMNEFQSDFYRDVRNALAGMQGVYAHGDRFVIAGDVLFALGSFALSPDGRNQIRLIAYVIKQLEEKIPPGVNWIIRVDGHTDITPVIRGDRGFRNNMELSLLRAQAVTRHLIDSGVNERRLIPTGFGEMFPVADGTDAESLQRNRRIELRLTSP